MSIPNKEVSKEYVNAISTMDWKEVITSVEESRRLLESLWNMDGEAVAEVLIGRIVKSLFCSIMMRIP